MRRLLHTLLPALLLVSGCVLPGDFGDFSFAPDDEGKDSGSPGDKDAGQGDEDGGDLPQDGGTDAGQLDPEDGGPDPDGGTDMLCMLANCDPVATCDSTSGVPICTCPATGYFDSNGDGTKCADLNECKAGTDECEQDSSCKNIPGSYKCDCKLGYVFSRTDNACIDECIVLLSTTCAEEALCLKPQGAGTCRCAFGYMDVSAEQNGSDCEVDTRCVGLTCDPLALCVVGPNDVPGCECPAGYSGDGTTCVDIDECSDDAQNDCDANAACKNTGGGFTCECKLGFSGDGKTCVDEDECALDEDDCSRDATCANTPGTFTCTCKGGFTGDGKTCVDVDECALGTATCSTNATCTNTPGAFTCACKTGFTGNGTDCQDIDECGNGQANCGSAPCTNTPGSYTCGNCPAGFEKNAQGACVDVDECTRNMPCSVNATCANSEGSFSCTCKGGYSGDGARCVDVDECAANTDNCDPNASCTNGAGTFACACNKGYEGSGTTCADVDECATNRHDCNATRGTCTNTPGAYSCACKSGYQGDGRSCDDLNECSLGTDNCDGTPDACVNTDGSVNCVCPSGYTGNGVGPSGCLRNECSDGSNNCDKLPAATCTDTTDGFSCACPTGSTGNGVGPSGCLRNECSDGSNNCDKTPAATCTDTADSFTCTCPAGNTGDGKGASGCLRNECTDGTENCDNAPLATCTDTTDTYTCACPAGYPQSPSTGGIGQNACCTPDGNTDVTHPNDGRDNDCDGLIDMPVLAAATFPEVNGATSGEYVSISATSSSITGTHTLQCRTFKRTASTFPAFAACTTPQFTIAQSKDKALNGAYRTEVRWAYANGSFSNVRTHDYYVHNSLHGAEKCTLGVGDAALFTLAHTKLAADLVGTGFTDPGAFTASTFVANPFVTLGFKPLTDGYFLLRGLDVVHGANAETPININSLRHRFVVGGNGRYVLMRRAFASRMDTNFLASNNNAKSANRCKAAQFEYSDQQGGKGNPHVIERCDAVVLNRAGAGVCITIGGTPATATIPFSHGWTGAKQFGYSDSAKFMYRQLLTERRKSAIGHFTVFSPKCDSNAACESGSMIYLPDRSVLRP
jgi:hypothetical protein